MFPREALHEALANALVHKDYESGVPVQVRVYPDRIVVENAGRPPAEWSTDDLTSHHAPRPSNMILAYVMRMNGIVHGWGDGFDLMRQSCVAANAAEPLVELGVSDTLVTFPLPEGKRGRDAIKPTNASTDGQIAHAAHAKGGNLAASGARAQGGRPGQSDGKNSEAPPQRRGVRTMAAAGSRQPTFAERSIAAANRLDMTNTDEYVLRVLTTNGRATAPRIAQVLNVSESTVRRSLRRLKEYGFIERIGSKKAGYWNVID